MNKRLTAIICLLLMTVAIPSVGFADAFGFSGDSDWGGSDWSSGSDWDYDSDWDSDWSSGSSSSGDFATGMAAGMLLDDMPWWAVLLILAVVLMISKKSKKNRRGGSGSRPQSRPQQRPVSYSAPVPCDLSPLRELDPNFSEARFTEKVSNLYVQMQDAWEKKDAEPMRPYMTDTLFGRFERQLRPFIEDRQTNHVERIAVLSAVPTELEFDEQNAIVTVRLSTRIVDYVTDDRTGSVIRGSKTKELFMTYDWQLIRSKDVITPADEGIGKVTCPNCGASLDIGYSAKCPYCDSVITSDEYNWVIADIKGISQRSA